MGTRVYGLLAGVNDYPASVGSLYGALNDVNHYRDFLTANFPADMLDLEVIKDSDATRPNIIRLFREHLGRAKKDDVVVFQFAGHGARWRSATDFKQFYPDGYDEGLVCYDSRRDSNNFDLADKELAVLLSEVARNDPHIVVVLDSCHSGSGTRSAGSAKRLLPRSSHTVEVPRPLESYIDGYYADLRNRDEVYPMPFSKHILLAACERDKQAFENYERRGIFSSTLLSLLDQHKSDISYSDLFVRIRATVRRLAMNQTPQFEIFQGFNASRGFLDKAVSARPRRFTAYFHDDSKSWQVDCGALNGLVQTSGKPTQMEIFEEDSATPLTTVTAKKIDLSSSEIAVEPKALDWTKRYEAELTSLPVPSLTIDVIGDGDLVKTVSHFHAENSEYRNIALISDKPHCCEYQIVSENETLLFKRNDGQLIMGVQGTDKSSVKQLFDTCVRSVAKWEHLLELKNQSKQVASDKLTFELEVLEGSRFSGTYSDDLRCSLDDSERVRCQLRVKNLTGKRMYLALIHFTDEYEITDRFTDNIPSSDEFVKVTVSEMETFRLGLLPKDGDWATHRFKLFASSKEIDTFHVRQKAIPIGEVVSTVGSRSLLEDVDEPKEQPDEDTWFTKTTTVNLVSASLKVSNDDVELADGQIAISGHPALTASLAVSGEPMNGRGVGEEEMAHALSEQELELVNWSKSRGAPATVLEFNELKNAESLKENPLKIEVRKELDEGEFILPVVFDGTHFLVAGDSFKDDAGNTQISINQIPAKDDGSRGVANSLKLYFYKTFLNMKKVSRLAEVSLSDDGSITSNSDDLKKKFAAAKTVLVLVHGLLSDSDAIARSIGMHDTDADSPLTEKFDLILCYDYEILNTSLSDSAVDFANKLAAIGVSDTDDTEITILAHSMGGLIARHYVECGAGKECVDHLVMCATPNAGTPLGRVDQASRIVSLMMNLVLNPVLAPIPYGAKILSYLGSSIAASKSMTKSLEQLNPDSDFLSTLNSQPDPGVRYSVFAGNFRQMPDTKGMFLRLLNKIDSFRGFDLLFGGAINDIVVSRESAIGIPANRSTAVKIHDAGCYHLNCFAMKEVLNTICDREESLNCE